jgi:hypothetical protein
MSLKDKNMNELRFMPKKLDLLLTQVRRMLNIAKLTVDPAIANMAPSVRKLYTDVAIDYRHLVEAPYIKRFKQVTCVDDLKVNEFYILKTKEYGSIEASQCKLGRGEKYFNAHIWAEESLRRWDIYGPVDLENLLECLTIDETSNTES